MSQRQPIPYVGQDLGARPHVALLFCDQPGAFIVATSLMRGLRDRFPGLTLDYFGGERTRELEDASRLVDARYSLFGPSDALETLPAFLAERRSAAGPYALAINLESDARAARACGLTRPRFVAGAYIKPASDVKVMPPNEGIDRLWHEPRWNRADLRADFPELTSQYIGEIFCRLARVPADFGRTETPTAPPPWPTPPVLISSGGRRSAKLWPAPHWRTLVRWLAGTGHEVGLLGAAPSAQGNVYHADDVDGQLIAGGVVDLRGTLTLPQVAGALERAHAFVTVDNGLMHLAAAVHTQTVALFGASPRRLWAPPAPSVRILEPSAPCSRCEENRFRNEGCLLPVHQCMISIEPGRVIREVEQVLRPTRR
ncbi:MAG: glycosyltransferase family 9 protein [Chloroflexi bacterium]|nr:glycosyltransferase family 9 protein [Chloroflexota bacterium]